MGFLLKLDKDLKGMPDTSLTLLLIALAILLVGIALFAPPLVKVATAVWVIAP